MKGVRRLPRLGSEDGESTSRAPDGDALTTSHTMEIGRQRLHQCNPTSTHRLSISRRDLVHQDPFLLYF